MLAQAQRIPPILLAGLLVVWRKFHPENNGNDLQSSGFAGTASCTTILRRNSLQKDNEEGPQRSSSIRAFKIELSASISSVLSTLLRENFRSSANSLLGGRKRKT